MMTLKPGRSSIFETFFETSPKEESQKSSLFRSKGSSSLVSPKNADLFALTDEDEREAEQEPTLWMSCSPGRDSSDNDAEKSLTADFVDAKSDDELPNSQMTSRCEFKTSEGRSQDGKSCMKCTPKPKKPVSGYALFYDDAKAAIVEKNPKVQFAQIAKIVATMWDNLDEVSKKAYKRKTKRYFAKRSSSSDRSCHPNMQIKARKGARNSQDQDELVQSRKRELSSSKKSYRKEKRSNVTVAESKVDLTVLCHRPDCLNIAVDHPRWSNDYCSSQCIVRHCKDVFNAWVSQRQEISNKSSKRMNLLQTDGTSDQLLCQ